MLRPKDGACGEAAEPPLVAALRAYFAVGRNFDKGIISETRLCGEVESLPKINR